MTGDVGIGLAELQGCIMYVIMLIMKNVGGKGIPNKKAIYDF